MDNIVTQLRPLTHMDTLDRTFSVHLLFWTRGLEGCLDANTSPCNCRGGSLGDSRMHAPRTGPFEPSNREFELIAQEGVVSSKCERPMTELSVVPPWLHKAPPTHAYNGALSPTTHISLLGADSMRGLTPFSFGTISRVQSWKWPNRWGSSL